MDIVEFEERRNVLEVDLYDRIVKLHDDETPFEVMVFDSEDFYEVVSHSFYWSETKEGFTYWENIANRG